MRCNEYSISMVYTLLEWEKCRKQALFFAFWSCFLSLCLAEIDWDFLIFRASSLSGWKSWALAQPTIKCHLWVEMKAWLLAPLCWGELLQEAEQVRHPQSIRMTCFFFHGLLKNLSPPPAQPSFPKICALWRRPHLNYIRQSNTWQKFNGFT